MLGLRVALTLTAAWVVAGCTASGGVQQVTYVGPTGGAQVMRSVVVSQPPSRVFANLVDRLQQSDVEVVTSDAANGYVVVEYRGDPEPYVDCGWIVAVQNGEEDRIRAAAAETSLVRPVGAEVVTVHRAMRLDTRMVVSLRPEGGGDGTRVDAHAVYVLTKSLKVGSPQGDRGQRRETIAFETGQIGRFDGRTVCHPTGGLERLAFDSLPATEIALERPAETGPAEMAEATGPGASEDVEFDSIVTTNLPPPDVPESAPPLGSTGAATAGVAEPATPTTAATAAPPVGAAPPSSPTAPASPVAATPPATVAAPTTLEDALAQVDTRFECAAIDADVGPGRIRLSGYVSDPADVERLRESLVPLAGGRPIDTAAVAVTPWPYCEILQVLAPYRRPGSELEIATVDGSNRLFRGDPLTLDVSFPPDTSYLYMGYVQSDGRVGYIATMSVREWAKRGRIRFRTGYDIDEPFGQEMVVAVTSETPLFEDARPAFEPAEQYLVALRQALADLQARDEPIDAAHVFIVTEPGPAS